MSITTEVDPLVIITVDPDRGRLVPSREAAKICDMAHSTFRAHRRPARRAENRPSGRSYIPEPDVTWWGKDYWFEDSLIAFAAAKAERAARRNIA